MKEFVAADCHLLQTPLPPEQDRVRSPQVDGPEMRELRQAFERRGEPKNDETKGGEDDGRR